MASAAVIQIDALLAPIAGDNPAGARLLPDRRRKMEDARKEFQPNPDDPSAPPIQVKPDWAGIIRQSNEILIGSSKDLLVVVRLVEALTKRHGFAGLRDGLKLARQIISDCWDRMHPVIEDEGDLEMRTGAFEWLSAEEAGALFPHTVRRVPMFRINKTPVSFMDWTEGHAGEVVIAKDSITRADLLDPEVSADLEESMAELTALEQALSEKLGERAPVLEGIRKALIDCQRLIAKLAPPTGAAVPGDAEAGISEGGGVGFTIPSVGGSRASRDEIYRQIEAMANVLADLEPHSPIPDLLHWACELGRMPFRKLITELVREPSVLAQVRLQLGIKEEQPPGY